MTKLSYYMKLFSCVSEDVSTYKTIDFVNIECS